MYPISISSSIVDIVHTVRIYLPRDEIFTAVGAVWETAFAYSTFRIIWYIILWSLAKDQRYKKVNG
jgi:hypothetical protein